MRPALFYAALMVCLLTPVWAYDFLTQDGPAHLHNAEIIRNELAGGQQHPAYELRGNPIPNILGHLLLAALSTVVGPALADKLVITLTCFAVGAAAIALRCAVRGREGLLYAVPFAAFVSTNRLWLLGFYSFLIGVALFASTAALAWRWRDSWTTPRAATISFLLTVGYFAHPVSLAATLLALAVIGLTTSRRAVAFLAAAAIPAIALIAYYVVYASSQAPLHPKWMLLFNLRVLTIANTSIHAAFAVAPNSPLLGLVTPAVLFGATVVVILLNGLSRERTFVIVTVLLFAVAFFGPEGLGNEHGNFMGQRLVLLAFIASLPILQFDRNPRLITALGLAAVLLQAGYLFGYGQRSGAALLDFREASRTIPADASVYPFVIKDDTRFRSSPELHASNLLGIGTQRVMWSNYETEFYYFPVKYREPLAQCSEVELQRYRGLMVKAVNPKRAWMVGRFVCVALTNRGRLDYLMTRGVDAKALVPWLGREYELLPSTTGRPGLDVWKRRRARR